MIRYAHHGNAMNENKRSINNDWIDPDDAPELTDAFFERADEYRNGTLVKRGRPVQAVTKASIKLRLDPDIIAPFRAMGAGWQTRMNDALKEWLKEHVN
jgi:uncharacterized protein (DUF4415 family)